MNLWKQISDRYTPVAQKIPFSVRLLNPSTLLIRERDGGEFPNIYLKLCGVADNKSSPVNYTSLTSYPKRSVLVMSDTGVATERRMNQSATSEDDPAHESTIASTTWNIATFLELINPNHSVPYVIITTHCHLDHTWGIKYLVPQEKSQLLESSKIKTTIVASAAGKAFITPYANLQEHGLYNQARAQAPKYLVEIWAKDGEEIVLAGSKPDDLIKTGILIFNTPGHTPDSLSWYDTAEKLLSVGDSFYEQVSSEQQKSWGERPMPTIFNEYSDLLDWLKCLDRLLEYVKKENAKSANVKTSIEDIKNGTKREAAAKRVSLSAAHVTAESDAEEIMQDVRKHLFRVLRNEEPESAPENAEENILARFRFWAPPEVLEKGRKDILPHGFMTRK